jgi:hypothetical protein
MDAGGAAMKLLRTLFLLLLAAGLGVPAYAHVGNKDVFEQIVSGPYKLFVTIRPPNVIPGVAIIEVRSSGAPIDSLSITPLLLTGEASKHPPTPDAMKRSAADPAFFTGSLWLMGSGSWQVRFAIRGSAGVAAASVPVSAAPTALLHMDRPLGILLGALGLVLVFGMVGIVVAAVREARLSPGVAPDVSRRGSASVAGATALVVAVAAVVGGGWWWHVEAADYAAGLYRASDLRATLTGDTLDLVIGDADPQAPGGWKPLKNKDLLLDHGHLMHLYAIRMPQMDVAFHLHPVPVGKAGLRLTLPAMPPGTYKLFADVVYFNGFPETETATLTIPANLSMAPLGSEDASAMPPPISQGDLGASYKLPDGYTMVWDRPATLRANSAYSFRFTLLDAAGKRAGDMQPYLGMAGHAAFVKDDFSTFAHTHPDGSAAMPAVMLADASTEASLHTNTDTPGVDMSAEPITSTVEFPYGFPSPGRYRIFIQMKHSNTVETGVFDAEAH